MFLYILIDVSMLVSLATGLEYVREKENPGKSQLGCSSGPESSNHSALFFPPFRVLCYFIYNI